MHSKYYSKKLWLIFRCEQCDPVDYFTDLNGHVLCCMIFCRAKTPQHPVQWRPQAELSPPSQVQSCAACLLLENRRYKFCTSVGAYDINWVYLKLNNMANCIPEPFLLLSSCVNGNRKTSSRSWYTTRLSDVPFRRLTARPLVTSDVTSCTMQVAFTAVPSVHCSTNALV